MTDPRIDTVRAALGDAVIVLEALRGHITVRPYPYKEMSPALQQQIVAVCDVLRVAVPCLEAIAADLEATSPLIAQVRKSIAEWYNNATPMEDLQEALLTYGSLKREKHVTDS